MKHISKNTLTLQFQDGTSFTIKNEQLVFQNLDDEKLEARIGAMRNGDYIHIILNKEGE